MESVILLVVLLFAVYPVFLVWRFLTLGIKAFKKYLRDDCYYVVDVTDRAEE